MSLRLARTVLLLLLLCALCTASAYANPVANAGFESPVLSNGAVLHYAGGQNIAGWLVVGSGVYLVQTAYAELAYNMDVILIS